MTRGNKALVAVLAVWIALGTAGWMARRANAQRERAQPHLWAASEGSTQQYDVIELRDRGRFIGFDLEAQQVRFPDCTLPSPDANDDQAARCLDAAGRRWELRR